MVDSAHKNEAPTCDLRSTLRMIEETKATGVMMFSEAGDNSRIVFDCGEVVAASSSRHFQIGQELVASGQVSQSLLDTVLSVQRRKKQRARLGDILVSLGVVAADGVREVLKRHWRAVLRHCLETGGGTFDFRQENISDGDVAARFSVGELLEEAQEGQS